MKHDDIQKIHAAGLITGEQRDKIVAHFNLKEDGGQFLAIISFIGAVLVAAGVALLISAHWNEIPRGVKIAVGILLMLGAHGFGWWLREVHGKYRKGGEALHFLGSCLFLANIALLGQVYNIVSRPPDAFLLWWLGIVALPWILRSQAQHILALLAFGVWFGLELNERGSLIFFGSSEYQILLYALLGLIYFGFGYCLRRTRFVDFAEPTEQLGLLLFLMFAYPMTLGIWGGARSEFAEVSGWIFPAMSGVALAVIAFGVSSLKNLTPQWRWTWALALVGGVALLVGQMYFAPEHGLDYDWQNAGYHWVAALGLFVFCLLQIQVGLQERSASVVNLGVAFIALNLITTYFRLIGSMERTGMIYVISGAFLIVFGVYLEKKRRRLLAKIKTASS